MCEAIEAWVDRHWLHVESFRARGVQEAQNLADSLVAWKRDGANPEKQQELLKFYSEFRTYESQHQFNSVVVSSGAFDRYDHTREKTKAAGA